MILQIRGPPPAMGTTTLPWHCKINYQGLPPCQILQTNYQGPLQSTVTSLTLMSVIHRRERGREKAREQGERGGET